MTAATEAPPSPSVALREDAARFETIYRDAAGDSSAIPWHRDGANPALVTWLNVVAPSMVRCGSRVAVVGCGLGGDARELIKRGYDVTAFDVSPTAVEWAKRLDPDHARDYHVADLFDLPPSWRRRYDLVVECLTLQSLRPSRRDVGLEAMSTLLTPHGTLLAIALACDEPVDEADGPPWPLTRRELLDAASTAGLAPAGSVDEFLDDAEPPRPRLRAVFRRA